MERWEEKFEFRIGISLKYHCVNESNAISNDSVESQSEPDGALAFCVSLKTTPKRRMVLTTVTPAPLQIPQGKPWQMKRTRFTIDRARIIRFSLLAAKRTIPIWHSSGRAANGIETKPPFSTDIFILRLKED
ncbi:hypothetical protein WN48_07545 [Eufriesea mexicana]|uniref:Uncharacterized protein n=1 Tax=Eufriesea mexicana TaxID=516756 RepID=A0A310SV82_9HYME|nr:hypothetical protein WN48_07545 [Eufriesea mexicana]